MGQNRDKTGANFLKMGIETRDQGFNRLIDRLADTAAGNPDSVLLTGASGTGKTLLARRVYEYKKQVGLVKGPLVEVNCGALEDKEALVALFGKTDEKGAGRQGALAEATDGMLFLDEAERLSPECKRRFLQAFETGRFFPLNSIKEEKCRFLLICAAGTEGGFSCDSDTRMFLSRIGLWNFTLPALTERHEDILPNIEFELAEHGRKDSPCGFEPAALAEYLSFAQSPQARWVLNFRDLNQSIRRLLFLAGKGEIKSAHVKEEINDLLTQWSREEGDDTFLASVDTDVPDLHSDVIPNKHSFAGLDKVLEDCDEFDRAQLLAVLEVCRSSGSMAAAGRTLFAKSRTQRVSVNDSDRLKKYLARFGLTWETVK